MAQQNCAPKSGAMKGTTMMQGPMMKQAGSRKTPAKGKTRRK